jgi:carbamoyltransferase
MTKKNCFLGIHDGHNCGAALIIDGEVVAAVNEERLSRNKNDSGYPRQSIDEVLKIGGVQAVDLNHVVFASNFMHTKAHLEEISLWYPVGIKEQKADQSRPKEYARQLFEIRRKERIEESVNHLGIEIEKVEFVEHHRAHLTAAYYTAPTLNPGKKILGLTCDGAGDNLCATVSICKDNNIDRISKTDRHASLGKIYSRVTYLMGMTPWEHEYKVMGLAPYSDPKYAHAAAEPLRGLLRVSDDGLSFILNSEVSTNYCYETLRDAYERERFDNMAGGVQLFTEEILVEWIRGCIAHTGITDIVCGGGVFMNVKANMCIAALPEVTSMYVMPSAGDESLSIGAALDSYYRATKDTNFSKSIIKNLYLGADKAEEEKNVIDRAKSSKGFNVFKPQDMSMSIAELLSKGEIVAVCRGRMEWGARALGNRSILCAANDFRRINEINNMIKMRDFWMPFAPSIIEERASEYFNDPKNIHPKFMTFAFNVIEGREQDLAAASHPKDHTIRPQIVSIDSNPDYHSILSKYLNITGHGVILNTSFNLHGEPIVYGAKDAFRVLELSGLRHLALNNFIISKNL